MNDESKRLTEARTNRDWWPNQLDLSKLEQNPPMANPMGEDFDYAEEFKTLDLDTLKRDIEVVMTTSQPWWPADYGHQSCDAVMTASRSLFTASRSRVLNSSA